MIKSTKVFLLSTVLQHNKQLSVETAPVICVQRSIGSFGQFVSLNLYIHTKQHQCKAVGVCCVLVSVFNILNAVTFESYTFKNTHRCHDFVNVKSEFLSQEFKSIFPDWRSNTYRKGIKPKDFNVVAPFFLYVTFFKGSSPPSSALCSCNQSYPPTHSVFGSNVVPVLTVNFTSTI